LVVGKDDDYDEIDMSIDEDEWLCLIKKLKMEDQDMQEPLDKLDKRIKRIEEKALDPQSLFGFCNATWTRWMTKIIKWLEANRDICLRSLHTQKNTLEISKNYIALLEKFSKERYNCIIYLEAFTVALQIKIRKLEGEAPLK
jgi:hypothetical protein